LYRTGVLTLKQWEGGKKEEKGKKIRKSDWIPQPILPDNQLLLSSLLRTSGHQK
jgi:hypothetical protein